MFAAKAYVNARILGQRVANKNSRILNLCYGWIEIEDFIYHFAKKKCVLVCFLLLSNIIWRSKWHLLNHFCFRLLWLMRNRVKSEKHSDEKKNVYFIYVEQQYNLTGLQKMTCLSLTKQGGQVTKQFHGGPVCHIQTLQQHFCRKYTISEFTLVQRTKNFHRNLSLAIYSAR